MFAIRCPHCRASCELEMPEGACLPFAHCPNCERAIVPLPNDCCVFCSYGETPCPIGHRHSASSTPGAN
ncbi:MAG TPA: GDCCVxC domain-containing (seleno)protein [Candidatus Paceibacterota bacterium]|nr:GDCCVxC domain-containing (seleno)protein [Candidatus Paceibacterota bacterium]